MKMVMKYVLPVLCLIGLTQSAWAQIPTGYFEGKFIGENGHKRSAALWIRHAVQNDGQGGTIEGTFAVLYHEGGKGQIFRVDELADGSEMWMQMFQASDGRIEFGEDATYSGTSFVEGGHTHLVLSVADYGAQIGCTERVELKSESSKYVWEDLPTIGHKIEGSHDSKGLMDAMKFTGRIVLDGQVIDGTYELEPLFSGAALMHRETVSKDAIDGHEIKEEVTAIVVAIRHKRSILSDYDAYEFLSVPPGAETCMTGRQQLSD